MNHICVVQAVFCTLLMKNEDENEESVGDFPLGAYIVINLSLLQRQKTTTTTCRVLLKLLFIELIFYLQ